MKRINFALAMLVLPLFALCKNEAARTARTPMSVSVYTTSSGTDQRLTKTSDISLAAISSEAKPTISVNPSTTFQTFIGIGSAITDASAEVFAKLPANKQAELLKAYYDKDAGIGYTLARTNIHSCDFSSGSYTYVNEGDKELASFSVKHDEQYRIPMIKRAIAAAGGTLLLYASPWSPPAFMKSNNDMLHGGTLLPEYYQPWANYFVKFIREYEKQGIPVWGVTIQNEPYATQTWESCIFTPDQERNFLKNYLGPTFAASGLSGKNIVVYDHNRGDAFVERANAIFGDPEAAKYAWGIGIHWYETWNGGPPQFASVDEVQQKYPSKKILFTEGCVERFDASRYQYWPNGERYGLNMIKDFNNGVVGWTDWNILLDERGGPNHVGNFCFAPVHANTQTGELIYTPSYYYIGHFSKFIRPGAKRVESKLTGSNLLSTSFLNSDGTLVTVVMNSGDIAVDYVWEAAEGKAAISIPAHAIQTLVVR